jgi:hypothetical protein
MKITSTCKASLLSFLLMSLGMSLMANDACLAAEKKPIAFSAPAKNTQYTQQYSIAVSPSHQIRIYEIHRDYPDHPPQFEGVAVKEEWMRAFSDYVDGNGRVTGYGQFVMANGDRIEYAAEGVTLTASNARASKTSEGTIIKRITGGTGKFAHIAGVLRYASRFDSKAGVNESHTEGEYWLDR